ncbi:hypothetical protein BH09CHL1_BH09CHL1_15440 [soil metagenome]
MRPLGVRLRRSATLAFALAIGLVPALSSIRSVEAADLLVGGAAIIADANGDNVRLRDEGSVSGEIIDEFPEGTIVDVLGGPTGDDDNWYRVAVDGETGYMIADYLQEYTGDGNGGSGDSAVITDTVNLRGGPSTADDVIGGLSTGDDVTLTGDIENGFYPVTTSGGTDGWVYGAYLAVEGSASGTTARTNDSLNLRSGPSTSDDVITVIPAGSSVTITGAADGDFVPVDFDGMSGWVAEQYLSTDGSSAETTSDVNFRTGASLTSDVIRVIDPGTTILVTGEAVDGFYPVDFDGESGWVSTSYVSIGGETPTTPSGEPEPEPEPVSYNIIWPVQGGTWQVSQGYHGSSHYCDGLWAYCYSFDLVNTNGDTAGQTVYSPVSGTVKWTEDATGGVSIDMGNGHAFAIFHITTSLQAGDTVTQGEAIGHISGPGENGNMGFDHIHITLWETTDGGNWSRVAVPFVGDYGIAGQSFPDGTEWYGTTFNP